MINMELSLWVLDSVSRSSDIRSDGTLGAWSADQTRPRVICRDSGNQL